MRYRMFLAGFMLWVMTILAIGCGVPKSDHEKIVRELEKVNQEKMMLSDEINQLKGENGSLSKKVTQMENEVNTLRQENENLKAKQTAKKPVVHSKKK